MMDRSLTPLQFLIRAMGLLFGLVVSAFVATAVLAAPAQADPAAPNPFTVTQPDGAKFQAKLFGDEWFNGVETTSGYTILQNPNGYWTYASTRVDGVLAPTPAVVGKDKAPASATKHQRDAVKRQAGMALRASAEKSAAASAAKQGHSKGANQTPSTGQDRSLVILAQFADQTSLGTTAAQWNSKFFGPTKSVKDYYEKASYGQFSFAPVAETSGTVNDGVVGWVTLPINHPNQSAINDVNRNVALKAIQAADPFVNFASYDTNGNGSISSSELHVTVIVAGYEASYGVGTPVVWGHRWALGGSVPVASADGVSVGGDGYTEFGEMHGDHMAAMGIMVHEMGHDLGLPDLYDTDYNSDGVGRWSVMAFGSWGYEAGVDSYQGQTPPLPDVWSKWTKGWITPSQVAGTQSKTINAATSASNTNVAVQMLDNPGGPDWTFSGGSSGEFFLVENRQKVPGTYDSSLPGSGLLVLHVNESRTSNADNSNRLVDVVEADGLTELDTYGSPQGDTGDVYPGSSNNRTLSEATNPNSNLINGSASGVSMSSVSDSGNAMTASFTAPGGSVSSNDSWSGATQIVPPSFTAANNNTLATIESGEVSQSSCPVGNTVWYKYTPSHDMRVDVNTTGSDFDTVLAVWKGSSLASLSGVACNDDAAVAGGTSTVPSFVAAAGETYYFQIGGYYSAAADVTATGDILFHFDARPANDKFANRKAISGATGTLATSNEFATHEPSEPTHFGVVGDSSVWFTWTAPSTGQFTFDTIGSAVDDTIIAAYTGASLPGTAVAGNDDITSGSNYLSSMTFAATSGTTYSIVIDGYGSLQANQGNLTLNWKSVVAPKTADMSLTNSAVIAGNEIVYTIVAKNLGPNTAAAAKVVDQLPAQVTFVSAATTTGTCTGTAKVTCALGPMVNNATATITIHTKPKTSGAISNTPTVSTSTSDPVPGNNSATSTVTITAASLAKMAELALRIGQPISTSVVSTTIPATLSWSAVTPTYVTNYGVRRKTAGAAWVDMFNPTVLKKTNITLTAGASDQFGTRVQDSRFGTWSPFVNTPAFKPSVVDNTGLTFVGSWVTTPTPSSHGGSYGESHSAGASVSLKTSARQMAIVAPTNTTGSLVDVYVDGAFVDTIDLSSAAATNRKMIATFSWPTTVSRTIKLVNQATAGKPWIRIDAIVVIK